MFKFGVTIREVPPDILRDATAEAKALHKVFALSK
jgi:hypothetical protein